MINKLLQRTAALSCALLLGIIAMAQTGFQPYHVSKVDNPSGIVNPNVKFLSSSCSQTPDLAQMREQARKVAAKADGQMYTITLNLEYDPELLMVIPVAYITDESSIVGTAFRSGENVLQGQLPSGTYNILTVFATQDQKQQYFVVKENVEVMGDLTFTINPAEATNHITTKIYGPDGELLKHGLNHFDESTNTYIVDEPSDVYYSSVENMLYQKGCSELFSFEILASGERAEEQQRTIPTDFYINDVSDRFVFIHKRITFDENLSKSYCAWASTDNLQTCEVENNPNDYVCQEYNYKFTPYGRDHDDGIQVMTGFWWIKDDKTPSYRASGVGKRMQKQGDSFPYECWINVPEVDPNIPGLNILVQTKFPDYGELEQIQWGEQIFESFTPTGWTYGTPIRVKNGQKEFVNFGHNAHGDQWRSNNLYTTNNNDTFFLKYLPAPSAFSYPAEQAIGNFGDNCPINAVNVTTYENNNEMRTSQTSYFVGRFGEVLNTDIGSTMTLKYNGEEVDLSTFSPSGKGTWEFAINYPNVEVDGLPGYNTTKVYFDQNQEDMTPPAVEMLHFRSEQGVTDRFATAADGTMEFYASDFHYQYYPDLWTGVFECQPVEVTVEYAPYGTEEWNELAVEEIPELYQEPGWGYFYRGSLAGVTGEGLNGWFDLRFRLQDASGNWMDQVVSPAFRIDDQAYSSVATVGSDNAREVARYNLAGQRIDANTPGVAIIRMSDGTARKVIQ